jgi:hypothetical protein
MEEDENATVLLDAILSENPDACVELGMSPSSDGATIEWTGNIPLCFMLFWAISNRNLNLRRTDDPDHDVTNGRGSATGNGLGDGNGYGIHGAMKVHEIYLGYVGGELIGNYTGIIIREATGI